MRDTTGDVYSQLRALRLNGMATAWADLAEQGGGDTSLTTARWLVDHLLQAEDADRAMRSIAHRMKSARFPIHRDLAGFDFEVSQVDQRLIHKLADLAFTQDAQNVVLIGGPGTGKTHLATALGVSGLSQHSKRVRFYSTVNLVNALKQEKSQGLAGRIAMSLGRMDLVVLDEFGYLPFSQARGALLYHLLSKLYERADAFAEIDVEIDRSDPVFARIHGLPADSPCFCSYRRQCSTAAFFCFASRAAADTYGIANPTQINICNRLFKACCKRFTFSLKLWLEY